MFGSYYEADYYENPVPYDHSDVGEPVPGWGTTVSIAGPQRVGVGNMHGYGAMPRIMTKFQASQRLRPMVMGPPASQPMTEPGGPADQQAAAAVPEKPLPWWVWPAAAAVTLGAVGYYGTKQGWL